MLDAAEGLLQELVRIRIGRTDQTRNGTDGGNVRDQAHLVHSVARHTNGNLEVEPIPVPISLEQQGVVETYPEKYAVPILVSARWKSSILCFLRLCRGFRKSARPTFNCHKDSGDTSTESREARKGGWEPILPSG